MLADSTCLENSVVRYRCSSLPRPFLASIDLPRLIELVLREGEGKPFRQLDLIEMFIERSKQASLLLFAPRIRRD